MRAFLKKLLYKLRKKKDMERRGEKTRTEREKVILEERKSKDRERKILGKVSKGESKRMKESKTVKVLRGREETKKC